MPAAGAGGGPAHDPGSKARSRNASENSSRIHQDQLQDIAAFSSRLPWDGTTCLITVLPFEFQPFPIIFRIPLERACESMRWHACIF